MSAFYELFFKVIAPEMVICFFLGFKSDHALKLTKTPRLLYKNKKKKNKSKMFTYLRFEIHHLCV